jgi:hypothetical protein
VVYPANAANLVLALVLLTVLSSGPVRGGPSAADVGAAAEPQASGVISGCACNAARVCRPGRTAPDGQYTGVHGADALSAGVSIEFSITSASATILATALGYFAP